MKKILMLLIGIFVYSMFLYPFVYISVAEEIEVVFQEGVNGYIGCRDSWLYERGGLHGTDETLHITDYQESAGYDRKEILFADNAWRIADRMETLAQNRCKQQS